MQQTTIREEVEHLIVPKPNYQKEYEGLKEGGGFWKPSEGRHKVKFLTEPVDDQFVKADGTAQLQWRFDVDVLSSKDGTGKRTWTIPKSHTPTSLRGQLVKVGRKEGRLQDVEVTIAVQGTGKEKRYTVFEAID